MSRFRLTCAECSGPLDSALAGECHPTCVPASVQQEARTTGALSRRRLTCIGNGPNPWQTMPAIRSPGPRTPRHDNFKESDDEASEPDA